MTFEIIGTSHLYAAAARDRARTKPSAFFAAMGKADQQITEVEQLRAENADLRNRLARAESERDTAKALNS